MPTICHVVAFVPVPFLAALNLVNWFTHPTNGCARSITEATSCCADFITNDTIPTTLGLESYSSSPFSKQNTGRQDHLSFNATAWVTGLFQKGLGEINFYVKPQIGFLPN